LAQFDQGGKGGCDDVDKKSGEVDELLASGLCDMLVHARPDVVVVVVVVVVCCCAGAAEQVQLLRRTGSDNEGAVARSKVVSKQVVVK